MADIGYTFGYYTELNPLRVKLAFLDAGLLAPETGNACELGFGQGLSANMHAAATLTQWCGTDFNPAQASFAQELVNVSGSQARLYDQAFAEFASRSDLPDFDYIGLHGIWSWISDANRAVIVDFIRRKLKVGGVLYISYNTQPGWASFAPMRHLMTEHADAMGASGAGILNRVDGALDFCDKLLATNPGFARANPVVVEKMKALKAHNRHYLAHEYFNRDWLPMHFATMAQWLEPAKITFACSANYLDHLDAVNLSPDQQVLLKTIPDPVFRETVRDFMTNIQFRKDYWVKGARRLSIPEQGQALRAQRVMLSTDRSDVSLKVTGAQGEAALHEAVYNPVLDALADHKPKTLAQLEQALKDKSITFAQLAQSVIVLAGIGHLYAVQDAAMTVKARKQTDKLNAYLIEKAQNGGDISYLASPVTGGGITVGRFQQLFLLAISQGKKQPSDWAQFVWSVLQSQNQKIVKEGKTLDNAEDNLAELNAQATAFAQKQLPILKALQIAG
ncbi:MAG: class I SAM-dependent methyltransferase [Ilumatobacteraceae bacterium]|nr:class I SAM-dependent methyltransferase [Ilumatobacteraceae bacterium]